ncbi:probable RNA helicase armi [Condylostylus longicornis]|uniref:probable RNA helicase armi n=1 Tax=Condylostylus longicornis TaxID=2530218 RepID=UPI00244E16AD|nr:probable RNA helicase armi [Condylostylus longicornis]
MFAIGKFLNWFTLNHEQVKIDELEQLNNEIDAAIESDNAKNNLYNSSKKADESNQIEEDKEASICFKKIGLITQVKSNFGMIDNSYMFNINKVAKNLEDLKVGYKVEYLAYKPEGEDSDLRICKITEIVEYPWDSITTEEEINKTLEEFRSDKPRFFNHIKRNVFGTITQKRDHFIQVETGAESGIEIDLDVVSIEFVPQEGDHVVLLCIVQNNEDFFDNESNVLECKSVSCVCKRSIKGVVTLIEYDYGVIDNEAYFSFDVVDIGYKIGLGDRVSAEVIENEAMHPINFRCIRVSLLEKASTESLLSKKNIRNHELGLNKNGIEVTDKMHFKFEKLGEIATKHLVVKNTSDFTQELLRYVFKKNISQSQLRLRNASEIRGNLRIKPGSSLTFKISAKSKRFGLSSEIFELYFNDFIITRNIDVEVGEIMEDNNENQLNNNQRFGGKSLKQRSYNAKLKWDNMQKRNLLPGIPVINRPRFIKQRIQSYETPERLKNAVLIAENLKDMAEKVEDIYSSLREELKPENYFQRFSVLLHLEEIERFIQMRQYDRDRAHMQKEQEYLSLTIENLAEKRPSLVIGDSVHATNPWSEKGKELSYQGYIHKVLYNKILIKFNDTFHLKYNGEDYRLEFFFSRHSFRKMHHSVNYLQSCLGNEYLFPKKVIIKNELQMNIELNENDEIINQDSGKVIPWFNNKLNHYQKVAIKNVLRGDTRPMPYVIFGPPGTGKTLTVIETILQLFKNCPGSRLLVGTPTNSSADLIASRLIDSNVLIPGDFIRLVGQNLLEKDLIPNHIKPYSATLDITLEGTAKEEMYVTSAGVQTKCRAKYLGRHRIIIGTCVTLGSLLYLGYPKTQFTHVIVDEAGQCIEPEIMTTIKQVDGKSGQIILAGDPLQLGPTVLQKYALEKGLDESFLVRLLHTQPYSKDKVRYEHTGYNPVLITKLIYNYRSVPSILQSYNDLFYDGELLSSIKANDSREFTLLKSLKILSKTFDKKPVEHGLIFYGIRGQNRQDLDSPSWYNGEEASQLFLFSLKLLKEGIEPKQIGIITPYQKQVKKIRNLFLESDLTELPKIGTVEEFQGQERDIILISTVRSAKALVHVDLKHTLGFLQSSKRMNVAISRARALLAIFGNPHLLSLDPNWEKLIQYCVSRNAYTGCDLPTSFDNKIEER